MTVAFELAAGAYDYRPLRFRRGDLMKGWDVYALQTALGGGLTFDGVFGMKTKKLVTTFQQGQDLVVDGIAGVATQRELGVDLAAQAARKFELPEGVPLGHVEKESGFQLGNHTAPYLQGTAQGSRDCGPVQMNSRYWPIEFAFHTPKAIRACADKIAAKRDEYVSYGEVGPSRALELACGSWNAPAWTDTLARGGTLPTWQADWIEGYIDRVTVYLKEE